MKPLFLALCATLSIASMAFSDTMRMAVTTSFHNSGLSDVLIPKIQEDIGLDVQLLVVGTGQALRLGQAGDVDAILVHSRKAEEEFIAAGHGLHRREIMFNDFVVIGPENDPAGIVSETKVGGALKAIHEARPTFVSRGDDSGTHRKEQSLWENLGFEPDSFGPWYRAVGAGMGAALNTASGMQAYILADRASWLNFGNKAGLKLLFSGDPVLFNQYAYIPVNPDKHSNIKAASAIALENWLVSDTAKSLINGYTINGEKLFIFNAQR